MQKNKKEEHRKVNRTYSSSLKGKIAHKKYYEKQRLSVFEILGLKCSKCGFNDIRALQIDHVNGGGAKELKSFTRNKYASIRDKILEGSKDYQVLCANCNWIKKSINNEVRK